MAFQKILQEKTYSLHYEPELRILLNIFEKPEISSEFRAHMDAITQTFVKLASDNGLPIHYISENIKMYPVLTSDVEWLVNEVLPISIQAGMKVCCIVVSEDVYAQMNIDDFADQSLEEQNLKTLYFNSLESAIEYFKGV